MHEVPSYSKHVMKRLSKDSALVINKFGAWDFCIYLFSLAGITMEKFGNTVRDKIGFLHIKDKENKQIK